MNYNFSKHIILILFFIFTNIKGQTNEVGLFLGGSLFHGDIGYKNAEYALLNTRPVLGLSYKRNFNYHFGISLIFHRGQLYANNRETFDPFTIEQNLHFKSKITEIGLITEFNFRPYLSRDANYNFTPFIFTGITKFYFNPQAKYTDGNWYNLNTLYTEGQDADFYLVRTSYELHGISIPFGFGYKINIYDFLTVNMNFGWRISFTDYIDDTSTNYTNTNNMSEIATMLSDPSENNFSEGFQRGDPYNNDKYGFIGITLLYSIKDPSNECNNIIY
tara:strand:- start:2721 stop:3545 length:825 start_codon:yes stop_codon:yes gene_type:complete